MDALILFAAHALKVLLEIIGIGVAIYIFDRIGILKYLIKETIRNK